MPRNAKPLALTRVGYERSAGEAHLKCGCHGCRGATGERDGVTVVRRRELEVELEGIVFSQVGRKSAVFKAVVKEAEPAADDQLGLTW